MEKIINGLFEVAGILMMVVMAYAAVCTAMVM